HGSLKFTAEQVADYRAAHLITVEGDGAGEFKRARTFEESTIDSVSGAAQAADPIATVMVRRVGRFFVFVVRMSLRAVQRSRLLRPPGPYAGPPCSLAATWWASQRPARGRPLPSACRRSCTFAVGRSRARKRRDAALWCS